MRYWQEALFPWSYPWFYKSHFPQSSHKRSIAKSKASIQGFLSMLELGQLQSLVHCVWVSHGHVPCGQMQGSWSKRAPHFQSRSSPKRVKRVNLFREFCIPNLLHAHATASPILHQLSLSPGVCPLPPTPNFTGNVSIFCLLWAPGNIKLQTPGEATQMTCLQYLAFPLLLSNNYQLITMLSLSLFVSVPTQICLYYFIFVQSVLIHKRKNSQPPNKCMGIFAHSLHTLAF